MFSIVNCFHNVQVLLLHFTLTWSTMWISCQLGNHALAARTSIPQSCKGCNIRPFYCVKKTRGKNRHMLQARQATFFPSGYWLTTLADAPLCGVQCWCVSAPVWHGKHGKSWYCLFVAYGQWETMTEHFIKTRFAHVKIGNPIWKSHRIFILISRLTSCAWEVLKTRWRVWR